MKKETTKKRKIDKKRWIVSIVALVLAALMVAGVAYLFVWYFLKSKGKLPSPIEEKKEPEEQVKEEKTTKS